MHILTIAYSILWQIKDEYLGVVSHLTYVAQFGVKMVSFGVMRSVNQIYKHSNFAPKQQGLPRSTKWQSRYALLESVNKTDFYVHQNIARCLLSYSKGSELLAAPCSCRELGLSSEVGQP